MISALACWRRGLRGNFQESAYAAALKRVRKAKGCHTFRADWWWDNTPGFDAQGLGEEAAYQRCLSDTNRWYVFNRAHRLSIWAHRRFPRAIRLLGRLYMR